MDEEQQTLLTLAGKSIDSLSLDSLMYKIRYRIDTHTCTGAAAALLSTPHIIVSDHVPAATPL